MSSGFGAFGGSGRCFPIWSDFVTCTSDKPVELCEPYRTDYLECLHNFREYKRIAQDHSSTLEQREEKVREAIKKVQEYEPKVGKEC